MKKTTIGHKAGISVTLLGILALVLIVFTPKHDVSADEIKHISCAADMLLMKEDPAGHYVLDESIDMAELNEDWIPFAFSGTFDGRGYTIFNLSVKAVGEDHHDTYDGNYKVYDTTSWN